MSKLKSKFPLLASLEGHSASIYCLAFHPSAPILATGCQDKSIILWDIDSYKPIATLLGNTRGVTCIAFHPSAPLLVSGSENGKMMLWDTTTHQCLSTTEAYRLRAVSCVAFRPRLNGTEDFDMVTGGSGDLLKLWKLSPDNTEATLFKELSARSGSDYGGYDSKCIVFHPTQPLVATAARISGSVFDIDPPMRGRPETLSESMILEGRGRHTAQALTIAFHPTAPIVVTGGKDKNIKLWELFNAPVRRNSTAQCVETLDDHDGDVTSVAFHPTAPVLFSCSKDRSIKIWHMAPDQMSAFCIETLTAQSGFTSLMVHPSGRFFATGCEDGTANLWDCSILNIDRQFKMARMRGLEGHVIKGLIPRESMYGTRHLPRYLSGRVASRRAGRIMLLEDPSANTASAKENASRLATLWAEAASSSPKPESPKTGSPKSPKSDQHGSGGSITRRRKKKSSRKVKRSASKTKHYRNFR